MRTLTRAPRPFTYLSVAPQRLTLTESCAPSTSSTVVGPGLHDEPWTRVMRPLSRSDTVRPLTYSRGEPVIATANVAVEGGFRGKNLTFPAPLPPRASALLPSS